MEIETLFDRLIRNHHLSAEEYAFLVAHRTPQLAERLSAEAVRLRKKIYGNTIFIRGLIEISNICKNDCLYCGIRRSNAACTRYRLSEEEILSCCAEGYRLGFRTFVLQGGEDGYYSDERLVPLLQEIKARYRDCALTLSLGERSRESYERLFAAGADRYLLRHETADKEHYKRLHPDEMDFDHRMHCLQELKEIGYQTGCGFMVGSPLQTAEHIGKDLAFIEAFQPELCGIGPFIPHMHTPFAKERQGTAELTCFLLSILRIQKPNLLLPATTALGTIEAGGREKGILSGANVIMPNLSPMGVRKKYELYNNKLSTGDESAQQVEHLKERMKSIGYEIVTDRGDIQNKVI